MKTIVLLTALMLSGCYIEPVKISEGKVVAKQPRFIEVDICQEKYLHCKKRHHWKSVKQCKRNRDKCDSHVRRHW